MNGGLEVRCEVEDLRFAALPIPIWDQGCLTFKADALTRTGKGRMASAGMRSCIQARTG
jgi:hypothetical protein